MEGFRSFLWPLVLVAFVYYERKARLLLTHLSRVIILVRDQDAALRFYKER